MIIVELSSVFRRQPTVGGADCSGTFGQDLINNLSCIIKVFFSLLQILSYSLKSDIFLSSLAISSA